MLLTPAPDLPLVIGLPMLLLFAAMGGALGLLIVLNRIRGQ
jgi:hypothetical protein